MHRFTTGQEEVTLARRLRTLGKVRRHVQISLVPLTASRRRRAETFASEIWHCAVTTSTCL